MQSRCPVLPKSVAATPQPAPAKNTPVVSHPLLQWQSTIGNRAVNRLLAAKRQSGLAELGSSESANSLFIQAKFPFQGLSEALNPQVPTAGTGKPLPEAVQQKMEAALNADFSNVRVHQDKAAEQIGAIAFTRRQNIHFAPGKYNPVSRSGQELLGHELAHVKQQQLGRVAAPQTDGIPINTNPALEAEADRLGKQAAQGKSVMPQVYRNASAADSVPDAIAPIQCTSDKVKNFFGIGAAYKKQKIKRKYKKIRDLIDQENSRPNPDQRKIAAWNEKLRKLEAKINKIGLPKRVQAEIDEINEAYAVEAEELNEFVKKHKAAIAKPPKPRRSEAPPGYVGIRDLSSRISGRNTSIETVKSPYGVRISAPDPDINSPFYPGYIDMRELGSDSVSTRSTSTGYDLIPDSVNPPNYSVHSYDLIPDSVNPNESYIDEEKEDKDAPLDSWEMALLQEAIGSSQLPPEKPEKSRRGSLSRSAKLRMLAEDIAKARSEQSEAVTSQQTSTPQKSSSSRSKYAWLSDEQLSQLAQQSKYQYLKQVNSKYQDEEKGTHWLHSLPDEQLESLGIKREDIPKLRVDYKKGTARNEYQLSFNENGKIYQDGKLFDTTKSQKTAFGEQAAIFTMNRNGKIYAGFQQAGQFHHSSFLAAAAAAGAGEISVKDGVLKKITNQSGHYLPGKEQVVQVLQELRENGVSLVGVQLKFLTTDLKGKPMVGFEGLVHKWLDDQKSWLETGDWLEAGTYQKIVEGDVDPQKGEIEALGFAWSKTKEQWKDAAGFKVRKDQLQKIREVIKAGGAKKLNERGAIFDADKHVWKTPQKVELDLNQQLEVLEGKRSISEIDEEHRKQTAAKDEQEYLFQSLTKGDINGTLTNAGLEWSEEYECWETPSNKVQLFLNNTTDLATINQLLTGQLKLRDIDKSLW